VTKSKWKEIMDHVRSFNRWLAADDLTRWLAADAPYIISSSPDRESNYQFLSIDEPFYDPLSWLARKEMHNDIYNRSHSWLESLVELKRCRRIDLVNSYRIDRFFDQFFDSVMTYIKNDWKNVFSILRTPNCDYIYKEWLEDPSTFSLVQ